MGSENFENASDVRGPALPLESGWPPTPRLFAIW